MIAATGTYLLHLALGSCREVVVRKRGRTGTTRPTTFLLPPGDYLYVGSAFGPGGLASRVGRHLSTGPKRRHWDVDFLLGPPDRTPRVEAWGLPAARGLGEECRWAAAIFEFRGSAPVASVPDTAGRVRGFGAGDCRERCGCAAGQPDGRRTHLFRLAGRPTRARISRLLGVRLVALGELLRAPSPRMR